MRKVLDYIKTRLQASDLARHGQSKLSAMQNLQEGKMELGSKRWLAHVKRPFWSHLTPNVWKSSANVPAEFVRHK